MEQRLISISKLFNMMNKLKNIEKQIVITTLIIGLPLYFDNGYFNMIEAKREFFVLLFVIHFILISIFSLFSESPSNEDKTFRITAVDISLIVFLLVCLFGGLRSGDIKSALLGNEGTGLGMLFWNLCVMLYFYIRYEKTDSLRIITIMFIAADIVFAVGAVNLFGLDPFGILSPLTGRDIGKYISTIGNINWYAGYCCIITPLATIMFLKSKNDIKEVLYFVTMTAGIFQSITCSSDCALVGVFVVGIIIFIHIVTGKDVVKNGIVMLTVSIILLIIAVLNNEFNLYYPLVGLQLMITAGPVVIGSALIGILHIILGRFKVRKVNIKNINIFGTFVTVFTLVVMLMCYKEQLVQPIKEYMEFNDSWGTNRGYIWRYSIKMFDRADMARKLIGSGPDSFGSMASKYYYDELYVHFGKRLVNAHNQFLQLLITTGIVGCVAYYTAVVGAIVKGIVSGGEKSTIRLALAVSLLAVTLQGVFNNFMTLDCVMIMILMALCGTGDGSSFQFWNEEPSPVSETP